VTIYYADEWVTLHLGNCLEVADWLAADVLVTDPPYGMAFTSGHSGYFGTSRILGDDTTETRDAALAAWGTLPALVFGRWSVERPHGTRMVLTWEKGNHVGMGDLAIPWKPNTEEIYVLGSGFVGHRGSSVLKCNAIAGTVGRGADGSRSHPTEKPVALMAELIRKCPPGVVTDPFAGSGATLRAAKNEGRRIIGVEIDERYCEIAARRLSQGVLDFGGVA